MPDLRVLPELKVTLDRVDPGQHAIPPDARDRSGISMKLGGSPDWIQTPEAPFCFRCGAPMTFVAQIDSVEHQNELNPLSKDPVAQDQDYMFGDVGMIYVFFCFDCLETKSIFQCY